MLITAGTVQLVQLGTQLAIQIVAMIKGAIQRDAAQDLADEGTLLEEAEGRTLQNLEENKALASKLGVQLSGNNGDGVLNLLDAGNSSLWRALRNVNDAQGDRDLGMGMGMGMVIDDRRAKPEDNVKALLKGLKEVRPDLFEGI